MLITLNVGSSSLPNFTFTVSGTTYTFDANTQTNTVSGRYYFYRDGNNWEFYALASGTLSVLGSNKVDLFLCGGGQSGRRQAAATSNNGGNGGARKTESSITIVGTYEIVCGAGGSTATGLNTQNSGGASTFGAYTSAGGTVSSGGHRTNSSVVNGGAGGYSFGDSSAKGPDGNSRRVGAGGGHGAYAYTDGVNPGVWNASNGGSYGGGNGGDAAISGGMTPYGNDGSAGSFFGAGGGGPGYYINTDPYVDVSGVGKGGAGYRGFVAIRNAR